MSKPDFEEFERARQEAVEALGQAYRQLESDPNGMHGEWLLDSLHQIERAVTAARGFNDVAARVVHHAVPRQPAFVVEGMQ